MVHGPLSVTLAPPADLQVSLSIETNPGCEPSIACGADHGEPDAGGGISIDAVPLCCCAFAWKVNVSSGRGSHLDRRRSDRHVRQRLRRPERCRRTDQRCSGREDGHDPRTVRQSTHLELLRLDCSPASSTSTARRPLPSEATEKGPICRSPLRHNERQFTTLPPRRGAPRGRQRARRSRASTSRRTILPRRRSSAPRRSSSRST